MDASEVDRRQLEAIAVHLDRIGLSAEAAQVRDRQLMRAAGIVEGMARRMGKDAFRRSPSYREQKDQIEEAIRVAVAEMLAIAEVHLPARLNCVQIVESAAKIHEIRQRGLASEG